MNDSSDPASPASSSQPRRKAGPLKWALRLALVLVLGLAVLVAFAPGILSGGWGKGRVEEVISAQLTGTATIDSLKLGWFRSPRIEGLTLADGAGKTVASVKTIKIDASLWTLATGGRDLGTITVESPHLDVVVDEDGRTNLQKLVKQRPEDADEGDDDSGDDSRGGGDEQALPVTFELNVTDMQLSASGPGFETVTIAGDAAAAAPGGSEPITFNLDAVSRQGDLEGKVAASGSYHLQTGAAEGTVSIVDLPVVGLDTLLAQRGLLVAAAGDYLSVTGDIQPAADNPDARHVRLLAWSTPDPVKDPAALTARLDAMAGGQTDAAPPRNLLAFIDARLADGVATGRGNVRFRAQPQLLAKLTGDTGSFTGKLADDVGATLSLTRFKAPLAGFDPSRVAVHTNLSLDDGKLVGDPRLGDLAWQNITGSIVTDNLAELATVKLDGQLIHADGATGPLDVDLTLGQLFDETGQVQYDAMRVAGKVRLGGVPTALVDNLAGADGAIDLAFGPRLDLTVEPRNTGPDSLTATVNLTGSRGSANASVAIADRIRLTDTAVVTLQQPGPVLQHYAGDLAGYDVAIGQPLTLRITKFDMPRPSGDGPALQPGDTTLIAEADLADVRVTDPADRGQPLGPLNISTMTLAVNADKLDKPSITLALDLVADSKGVVARYGASGLRVVIDASTTLDAEMKTGPIALAVQVNNTAEGAQPLESMTLKGRVSADFATFSLTDPATIDYVLMPQVLPARDRGPTIAGPTPLPLTLGQLETPITDFAVNKVKARLTAAVEQAALAGDPRYESARLANLDLDLNVDGPANTLKLDLSADTAFNVDHQRKGGSLSVNANLADVFDAAGNAQGLQQLDIDTTVELSDLPTAWIDAVAPQTYSVNTMAGDILNLTLAAKLQQGDGTIDLTADAPLAQANAHGRITDGVLTLTQDADAAFSLTEEFSRELINHPMLKQAVKSENPVTLFVQARGFKVPLERLMSDDANVSRAALANVEIPRLTIDPGKLIVRNAGLIKTLIDLPQKVGQIAQLDLKSAGALGGDDDTLEAWFTPVDLRITKGVAMYSRMDMLIGDHYQVATWGRLNLNDHAVRVGEVELKPRHGRMVLGIADRALRRVYGITEFQDQPDYVDQFIMAGPIDALGPDTQEMGARLGLLTGLGAAGQIAGDDIANEGMKILKQIGQGRDMLDKVLGKDDQVQARQFETPPPPRKPFPWPEEQKPEPQKQKEQPRQQTKEQPGEQQPKKEEDIGEKLIKEGLKRLFE